VTSALEVFITRCAIKIYDLLTKKPPMHMKSGPSPSKFREGSSDPTRRLGLEERVCGINKPCRLTRHRRKIRLPNSRNTVSLKVTWVEWFGQLSARATF